MPFFRFLDPASARVVSVYRQNATGAIGLTFANGTRGTTTGKLALGTWANIAMHVITNGAASTVDVRLNGTQVYSSNTQSLGTAGVSTIQIGNDTAAQAFNMAADTIDVQNAADDLGRRAGRLDPHREQRSVERLAHELHLPVAALRLGRRVLLRHRRRDGADPRRDLP